MELQKRNERSICPRVPPECRPPSVQSRKGGVLHFSSPRHELGVAATAPNALPQLRASFVW